MLWPSAGWSVPMDGSKSSGLTTINSLPVFAYSCCHFPPILASIYLLEGNVIFFKVTMNLAVVDFSSLWWMFQSPVAQLSPYIYFALYPLILTVIFQQVFDLAKWFFPPQLKQVLSIAGHLSGGCNELQRGHDTFLGLWWAPFFPEFHCL